MARYRHKRRGYLQDNNFICEGSAPLQGAGVIPVENPSIRRDQLFNLLYRGLTRLGFRWQSQAGREIHARMGILAFLERGRTSALYGLAGLMRDSKRNMPHFLDFYGAADFTNGIDSEQ